MQRQSDKLLLVVTLGLTFGVACSTSKFGGSTGRVGSTNPSTLQPKPPTESSNLPPYLDTDGVVKGECKEIKPLPTTTTSLTLQYEWHASGDKAEYTKVVATPVVGRLKSQAHMYMVPLITKYCKSLRTM
jgi:hypothetical protein